MLNIYVCVGSACHQKGSYNILHELQHIIEEHRLEDEVNIKAALCLGRCTTAVSVRLGDDGKIYSVSKENIRGFFENDVLKYIHNR